MKQPCHGGPDALGAPAHDFSTNSNACGPCPVALQAVRDADGTRYPDPGYHALQQRLAQWHGVDSERILLAASASEFITRITILAALGHARHGQGRVWVPAHAYADYAHAALTHGLPVGADLGQASLIWVADPSSPYGRSVTDWTVWHDSLRDDQMLVLDCAYSPLRLSGHDAVPAALRDRLWQLWTPNKALGLTGVRGAYAIAPRHQQKQCQTLRAMGPSWPIGAHGVAMLDAWVLDQSQAWLRASLDQLRQWKLQQFDVCVGMGWHVEPGVANFMVARSEDMSLLVPALRRMGVKLRDTTSFGVPQAARLGVLPPASQHALREAVFQCRSKA